MTRPRHEHLLDHAGTGRLTLSRILELVLQKSPRDHSSVTLTRNARGATQIEVVVRTGEDASVATPDEALAKAIELYDVAIARYPSPEQATPEAKQ